MFKLIKLPYESDALEPHIDKETVEIHHGKHHQTYVNNLNNALEGKEDWLSKTPEEVVRDYKQLPEELQTAVRNNGGGVYNHDVYWMTMSGNPKGEPEGKLKEAIDKKWGSFDAFKEEFKKKSLGQFGSGWVWLVMKDGVPDIIGSPNQDSPVTDGYNVLMGVDVWEHAYYLKYQNRRADYVDSWWKVLDWAKVEDRMK
jgi:Fe-Mn family superoxide dismutase